LEFGTLGREQRDVYRRLMWLITGVPNITISFHTVISETSSWTPKTFFRTWRKSGLGTAWNDVVSDWRNQLYGKTFFKSIARNQKFGKKISAIVRTRRDARMMQMVYGIKNVVDHPLAFYGSEQSNAVLSTATRQDFQQLAQLQKSDVVLGCFGFVGRYKGIDVAISALKLLPPNFHLAIFGGVHPGEIKKNQPIDPFLRELIDLTKPGKTMLTPDGPTTIPSGETAAVNQTSLNLNVTGKELLELATTASPQDVSGRVHYMGALSDSDFPKAMAVCDTVVLPYMEVGQSSSGPISVAVDMQKHIIAARTRTFMQFARYHPDRYSMFDIGNFVQLSQLIRAECAVEKRAFPEPTYNTATNAEAYRKALSSANGQS
jgi:glycosyltransferase involved in cell wall biosynthesis